MHIFVRKKKQKVQEKKNLYIGISTLNFPIIYSLIIFISLKPLSYFKQFHGNLHFIAHERDMNNACYYLKRNGLGLEGLNCSKPHSCR